MDAVCDQRKEGLKAAAAVRLFLPIVYPEIDPAAAAAKEKQGLPRAHWPGLPRPANMIPLRVVNKFRQKAGINNSIPSGTFLAEESSRGDETTVNFCETCWFTELIIRS